MPLTTATLRVLGDACARVVVCKKYDRFKRIEHIFKTLLPLVAGCGGTLATRGLLRERGRAPSAVKRLLEALSANDCVTFAGCKR